MNVNSTKLVLLHGALGDRKQLEKIAALNLPGIQIQAINFNGHGEKPLSNGFHLEGFSRDILDYMEEQKLEHIHLFGYSMGGYVALYLAQKHPDRIKKIMTLGTKFDWSQASAEREIKQLNPEKIEEKIPTFARVLEQRHEVNDWKKVLANTAELMLDLAAKDYLNKLEELNLPVRLCLGDRDQMVSLEETLSTSKRIPQASLSVFPETIHPIEKVDINRLQFELHSFFGGGN